MSGRGVNRRSKGSWGKAAGQAPPGRCSGGGQHPGHHQTRQSDVCGPQRGSQAHLRPHQYEETVRGVLKGLPGENASSAHGRHPTPSTPRGRPSPPWMSSMLSNAGNALSYGFGGI
ncbi:unnamed protein product [Staurois parvus]|uniref:Uncharacterized protein n=1 Tax=Staurois parvus TaxID=386267 RepID=A0ABN9HF92_9NEOB|nr:unnamed protein product [Staurois parvus]